MRKIFLTNFSGPTQFTPERETINCLQNRGAKRKMGSEKKRGENNRIRPDISLSRGAHEGGGGDVYIYLSDVWGWRKAKERIRNSYCPAGKLPVFSKFCIRSWFTQQITDLRQLFQMIWRREEDECVLDEAYRFWNRDTKLGRDKNRINVTSTPISAMKHASSSASWRDRYVS